MTYNIDDTVKLRSWDDLVKEFGEDDQGDIKIGNVWAFRSNKHCYGNLATYIMEDVLSCLFFDHPQYDGLPSSIKYKIIDETLEE